MKSERDSKTENKNPIKGKEVISVADPADLMKREITQLGDALASFATSAAERAVRVDKIVAQLQHDIAQLALCVDALNQKIMQATAPKIITSVRLAPQQIATLKKRQQIGFAQPGQKPCRRIHVHIDKQGVARVVPPIGSKVC